MRRITEALVKVNSIENQADDVFDMSIERLFETEPDGTRDSTRYAVGYFQMMRDYVFNGRLSGSYGDGSASGSRNVTTPYGGTYSSSASLYRPPGW